MAISASTSDKIRIIGLWLTIAVVLHHAHNLQFASGPIAAPLRYAEEFFHYGLRALAVPFFFICSGYFLCSRADFLSAWPGEVRKRVRSLLLPFVVWSAGWIVVLWALQQVPSLEGSFGRGRIELSDAAQVTDLMTRDPIPHPLWYMRDLFLLTLLSPAIVWLLRRGWGTALYFAGALAIFYSTPSIELRESGDFLFFGIGVVLAQRQAQSTAAYASLGPLLGIASFGLIAYHCWWVDTRHAETQWLLNTAALLGLPAIWLLYDRVEPWVRTAGMLVAADFALFIYMGHEPLVTLVRKAMVPVLGGGTAGLLVIWLGSASAVIGGLVLTAVILRQIAPGAYALLSGGRVPGRKPVREEAVFVEAPVMARAPAEA
jgi:surface polysaccharide O-acyltransferase-like enzyme